MHRPTTQGGRAAAGESPPVGREAWRSGWFKSSSAHSGGDQRRDSMTIGQYEKPTEQQKQRLITMFEAVSDPASKQDCATVSIETPPGELTIEYGAFRDGDVLNVPTVSNDHDWRNVIDRVDREPMDEGSGYVVYDIDDLSEFEAAELILDASDGWSDLEIIEANLRTIETGGLTGRFMDWLRNRE